jgi:hypothetical protein
MSSCLFGLVVISVVILVVGIVRVSGMELTTELGLICARGVVYSGFPVHGVSGRADNSYRGGVHCENGWMQGEMGDCEL